MTRNFLQLNNSLLRWIGGIASNVGEHSDVQARISRGRNCIRPNNGCICGPYFIHGNLCGFIVESKFVILSESEWVENLPSPKNVPGGTYGAIIVPVTWLDLTSYVVGSVVAIITYSTAHTRIRHTKQAMGTPIHCFAYSQWVCRDRHYRHQE